jgi:hypothetical protein
MQCKECSDEITGKKWGKANLCAICDEEGESTEKYTGVMLYGHKGGAVLQVNSDPELTKYILNTTKLQNKGSNLNNNLKVNSNKAKSNGMVYSDDVVKRNG